MVEVVQDLTPNGHDGWVSEGKSSMHDNIVELGGKVLFGHSGAGCAHRCDVRPASDLCGLPHGFDLGGREDASHGDDGFDEVHVAVRGAEAEVLTGQSCGALSLSKIGHCNGGDGPDPTDISVETIDGASPFKAVKCRGLLDGLGVPVPQGIVICGGAQVQGGLRPIKNHGRAGLGASSKIQEGGVLAERDA